jgi:hypothetical protein
VVVVVGSPFPSSYFTLSQSSLFLSFFRSFFLLLFPFCGFHDLSVSFQALIYETCIHTYPPLSLTRSNPRDNVSLCRCWSELRLVAGKAANHCRYHVYARRGSAEAGPEASSFNTAIFFYQVLLLLLPSRTKYACVGDVHTHIGAMTAGGCRAGKENKFPMVMQRAKMRRWNYRRKGTTKKKARVM